MTNKQLLHALTEIDDRFLAESPQKRLWIRWAAAAACLCLVLAGVWIFAGPQPAPQGIGGDDNHAYHYAYRESLYTLDTQWLPPRWLAEYQKTASDPADPEYLPPLLAAIKESQVPRAALQETFTEAELDILYSEDPAAVTRTFASPYAVVVGDRAFAPRFYLNATEEELQRYGITQEMITPKIMLMRKDQVIDNIFPYSSYTDMDYAFPYQRKIYSLNILSHLDIEGWAEKTYLESNFETVPSLLLAIETFGVSKEEFQTANRNLIAYYEQRNERYFIENYCFTREEIDLLYAGEGAEFTHAFASPYAIVAEGKAYPPAAYLGGHPDIPQTLIDQKRTLLREHGIIE